MVDCQTSPVIHRYTINRPRAALQDDNVLRAEGFRLREKNEKKEKHFSK